MKTRIKDIARQFLTEWLGPYALLVIALIVIPYLVG